MESEEQGNNQPAYSDRRGRVKLAIWENESPSGVRYVAEITRSWKDGEEYEKTHRFDEQDLLGAAKLAHVADDWIARQKRKQ